ncbi:SHOCT domain-containing protein [Natronococcus jeotgali]|uniref:SHOCT domain-containing protein n=1 Tax=Natronococcus jeotgali DSM 18795 TaxID=1227498 RepID=L9Y056_9EURY|nr:SHOCT domain-containing protein [Natronococcus jeotgali]ELY66253.1 hypothetical protein C492_01693 [Natronococcus jeotgali DSM 18795]
MTTDTTDRQLVWVILAIAAALVAFPMFAMGFGMMGAGPMMDGTWGTGMWGVAGAPGWMLIVGVGMQLLFLAVIVGAVYLGYRAVTAQDEASDPALEELRAAYARGDLSDEEYERRRDRLETEP